MLRLLLFRRTDTVVNSAYAHFTGGRGFSLPHKGEGSPEWRKPIERLRRLHSTLLSENFTFILTVK